MMKTRNPAYGYCSVRKCNIFFMASKGQIALTVFSSSQLSTDIMSLIEKFVA